MIILRDSTSIAQPQEGAVIALGNFDGLHLGHQSVIAETVARAKRLGKPAALLTFEPHPYRLFRPDAPISRLLSFNQKARLLESLGIDFMRVVRFTRAFSEMSAESFVAGILHRQLQVSHVFTGDDFVFGHKREGNVEYLRAQAARYGFGYTACPALLIDGERCSSTRIRKLLAEGHVKEAASLLGRPYSITSYVRHGEKRGQTLGFPTANIWPMGLFTPQKGVYAVRGCIRGKWVNGVANLGIRPTFGGERLQLEVHFFDFNASIYGERIEVAFIERIRDEKKFDSIEALKKQIVEDGKTAHLLLRSL